MWSSGASELLRLVLLLALFACSTCLYEDQIGKFDWRQTYVGRLKASDFDAASTAKRLIVATEANVVAALGLKSGELVWRRALETGPRGALHALKVIAGGVGAEASSVVTVSGSEPAVVRGWDAAAGHLLWEWTLRAHSALAAHKALWAIPDDQRLYHVVPVPGSHLEVTAYDVRTGDNSGATSKYPAPWIGERCVLSKSHYTCITGQSSDNAQLISLDFTSNLVQLLSKPVSDILGAEAKDSHLELKPLSDKFPGVLLNDRVITIKDDAFQVTGVRIKDETSSTYVLNIDDKIVLLQSHYRDESFHVLATDLTTGARVPEYSNSIPLPGANYPTINSAVCAKTARNNLACRILVTGADDAVYFLQNQGKMAWVREEALSQIVGVEMVDLPISELEAAIETEFDNKENDIFGMVSRRLKSQITQLKAFYHTLLNNVIHPLSQNSKEGSDDQLLVRDEFGLHNIIIVVSSSGKVFAIDNLSGNIIWKRYIPFLSTFNGKSDSDGHVLIYLQRTTRHLPYDAQCTIVARHKFTGEGMLFTFNPITGAAADLGIANLGYRIKQTSLLHHINEEFLKGIVILDENDLVHVYPPSCAQHAADTYFFVADPASGVVQGYILKEENKQIVAYKTWLIRLGGSGIGGHRITNVAMKNPIERVHSQGKVMGDRSVLYKYINPNLVAFVTEGPDPVHKDVLNVYLVDVVSGAIVSGQSHRRAKGPVKIVHSENWLVYSYYSEKSRRPEIATLELYEGPQRSGSEFSSLDAAGWQPEIARQGYILPAPAPPLALATTVTVRGIASKDILISLSTGAVVELPWVLLDPRRPTVPMTNEMREEGLIQYTPELPLPSEAVINYNQTILNVRNIHTSPSGLESTCLVFVYGLDIFYTRVSPSKTFDLLKEDFDYTLIVLVLIALVASSYAAKRFASRKVLRQAWK